MFGEKNKYFIPTEGIRDIISKKINNSFDEKMHEFENHGLHATTVKKIKEHTLGSYEAYKPIGTYIDAEDFSIKENRVSVNGETFSSPVFSTLKRENIKKIIIYAMTIGKDIPSSSYATEEFFLDIYGTISVDTYKEYFKESIIEEFSCENVTEIGPGLFGMPLNEMNNLNKLLNLNKIGVSLSENFMLKPSKSCAGILILTENPLDHDLTWCGSCKGNHDSCYLCKTFRNKDLSLAVDIGTTTVSIEIIHDQSKLSIYQDTAFNLQRKLGKDIIARLNHCKRSESGLSSLHNLVIETINNLIDRACKSESINKDNIKRVIISGNSAMAHIFAKKDPTGLLEHPFTHSYKGMLTLSNSNIGLNIKNNAHIIVLPAIGNQVGGDIVSGIMVSKMLENPGLTVFIDIGTNGEIVVYEKYCGFVTSTAAGPALEGGEISSGALAVENVICGCIEKDNKVLFNVIGQNNPISVDDKVEIKGVCGSGIISILALFVKKGLISKEGRIEDYDVFTRKNPYSSSDSDKKKLIISKHNNIFITQEDIRQIQLAKGAIAAGFATLINKLKKTVDEIDQLIISGNFGKNLNISDAITLGLIPPVEHRKVTVLGNTSLEGAVEIARHSDKLEDAILISEAFETVELGGNEDFEKNFIDNLNFHIDQ